jgi:uncharacterized protein (TIGR02246 family)
MTCGMTDEQAIREAIERWMRATRDGELDSVIELMAEDVVFTVAGREPFGKATFIEQSKALAGATIDGQSEMLEVTVVGAVAWTRTRLEVSMSTPDGKHVRRAGHTLSIWRKESDGKWRLARDANLLVAQ